MRSGERRPAKPTIGTTTPKKSASTVPELKNIISGHERVHKGRAYEDMVADYFRKRDWMPRGRYPKYGFEYDLYAKRGDEASGDDEYLIVECKSGDKVSTQEVARFINKVKKMYRHLPERFFEKPKVHVYLCYAGVIDKNAETLVKNEKNPPIKLKFMPRKSK